MFIKILKNNEIKINNNVFTIKKSKEIIKNEFLNKYYCNNYFNSNLYINKIYITNCLNSISNTNNKKEIYYYVNEILQTLNIYGIKFKD